MASIIVEKFGGIAPKISRKQLADNMAGVAEDCYLAGEDLKGINAPGTSTQLAGALEVDVFLPEQHLARRLWRG